MRLDKEEYLPYAPETVGPTVRINHDSQGCSGDSRSMAVWRNPDGSVSAKCYRCGLGGSTSTKASMFKAEAKQEKVVSKPTDLVSDWELFSPKVAAYLGKCGLNETLTKMYGIEYSPSLDGLWLPVYNDYRKEQGQVKRFSGPNRFFSVHLGARSCMYTVLPAGARTGWPVVIVEDLISAIRVHECCSLEGHYVPAFALLGSELNDYGLAELLRVSDKFLVWMDNDNAIINRKANALRDRLNLFGTARIVRDYSDPKDYPDEVIRDVIVSTYRGYK